MGRVRLIAVVNTETHWTRMFRLSSRGVELT